MSPASTRAVVVSPTIAEVFGIDCREWDLFAAPSRRMQGRRRAAAALACAAVDKAGGEGQG